MTFPGYPLPAAWTNETAMLNNQAQAHNDAEIALNDLQAQVISMQTTLAAHTSQIADLQTFISQFDGVWATYTPVLSNVTVGAGTRDGEYLKIGRLLILRAGFVLGAGCTMSTTAPIGIGLPPGLAAVSTPNKYPVVNAWANNSNYRWGGSGIVASTSTSTMSRFADENSPLGWKQGEPFTWGVGDGMSVTAVLQTTT